MTAPLTDVERRALKYLAHHGSQSAANLGAALWQTHNYAMGSCPFARPAGALLARLRKRGLTRKVHAAERDMHEVTRAGIDAMGAP